MNKIIKLNTGFIYLSTQRINSVSEFNNVQFLSVEEKLFFYKTILRFASPNFILFKVFEKVESKSSDWRTVNHLKFQAPALDMVEAVS